MILYSINKLKSHLLQVYVLGDFLKLIIVIKEDRGYLTQRNKGQKMITTTFDLTCLLTGCFKAKMNMKSVVIFPVFFASTISFTLFGHIDFSIYNITGNGASEKIVYLASSPEKSWLAKSTYNRSFLKIGQV